MTAALTRWLEQRWYGGVRPARWLRGVEALYAAIVRRRRSDFLRNAEAGIATGGARAFGLPIVVVGNITAGGAGKTPLTIALVDGLRARGFRPGVISRGYGRRGDQTREVRSEDAAADVGDEPLLIARRTGVPVAVAAARCDAAQLLAESGDVDVLIADDGLQHYALPRDIEILVIDGRRGFGNGRLLPAGPLREPLARASSCDFVVVNAGRDVPASATIPPDTRGDPAAAPIIDLLLSRAVTMVLRSDAAVSLQGNESRPLASFRDRPLHAVAGIADPERFFASLRHHGLDPMPHPFPDHHAFTAADLAFGDDAPVLMTEKDAVKCARFANDRHYAVPVDGVVPDAFLDAVAERLREIVAEANAA